MKAEGLETADIIAAVALIVSVGSWGWSSFIESRMKGRDDRRSFFDATLGNPFTAKLDLLEPILLKLDTICSSATSPTDRGDQLSDLQQHEHGAWFMSLESFLSVQDPNVLGSAHDQLSTYWDEMADLINDLSIETNVAEVIRLRQNANRLGHNFLTKERAQIQKLRARV